VSGGVIVVIDTSVLVSAMLGPGGASREVIRRALDGRYQPVVGEALFAEYEAAVSRAALFEKSPLTERERQEILDALLATCRWTRIYYGWRPNVRDESDNHLVELAVAAGAEAIVTKNLRDFANMELKFESLRIVAPSEIIKE
jgi:putative PIN family toxin of toxin-antitoxin system